MSTKRTEEDVAVSLWSMLTARSRALAVIVVVSVLAAATSLGQPLVVNRLITEVGGSGTASWIILLIALLALSSVLGALQKYLLTRTAERAVLALRRRITERMIRLPMRVYDTSHNADLVTRLSTDTSVVRAVFTGGLVEAAGGGILVIGAIIAMAVIDPYMLVIVVVVAAVGVSAVVLASKRIQTLTLTAQEAVGQIASSMDRALSAIRTVKATRAEQEIEREIDAHAVEAQARGIRIARTEALLSPVSGIVMQASLLVVVGIGGTRVASGVMPLADLVTFILFLFMLIGPLARVFTSLISVRSAQGAIRRINQLVTMPSEDELTVASGDPEAQRGRASEGRDQALVLRNVSFSYDEGRPVLDGISLDVPSGRTTAIVGPSGAGKSTLLALIERFHDPAHGTIRLHGRDIASLARHELRSRIAFVEQDAAVLSGNVRTNLCLGSEGITDAACWDALSDVNLCERFARYDGMDTVLGERGVNLSGGEKQRLALARALLSPAELLLLDEPTSAMDSQNERITQDALKRLSNSRTLVVVAHRLATVQQADQIVVLRDGSVAATGTHDDLLKSSATYQALAWNQFISGQADAA